MTNIYSMQRRSGHYPILPTMSGITRSKTRMRLWVGLIILGAGSYLIGGIDQRLELAASLLRIWWPWALLTLAAINLGRTIVRAESLVAPGFIAMAALTGLLVRRPGIESYIVNLWIPGALIVFGALLALSYDYHRSNRWVRVLTSARVRIHDQLPEVITAWAIAGELRLDLAGASLNATQEVTIAIKAILGHVHLDIPHSWPTHLPADPRSDHLIFTKIGDIGVRSHQEGDYGVTLRLSGFCGAITLLRH
jgi:hypothetical protein